MSLGFRGLGVMAQGLGLRFFGFRGLGFRDIRGMPVSFFNTSTVARANRVCRDLLILG